MATPLNTLKNWFKTGLKPPQAQFWAWLDSFRHKDDPVPVADISGLQTLLDAKVDKKDIIQQKGVFDPDRPYVYNADLAEYVSYVNEGSGDEFFRVERWFRLLADTVAGESPETAPTKWKHIGTVLGEIAIEDVVGLREELDDLAENGGTGGGHVIQDNAGTPMPQQTNLQFEGLEVENDAGNSRTKVKATTIYTAISNLWEALTGKSDVGHGHTASQITPAAGNAGKLMIVDPVSGNTIAYSAFLASQILQLSAIDVSDPTWAELAERLLLVKKVNGAPVFEGAAELIDLILPPATITSLMNDAGWVGETRTLTGENFLGEIAKLSQLGMGTDGTLFLCTSSSQGTQGGANGSASFRRNRSVDALDMSVTNDVNIANLLDPTRVGGNADTGWDTVNNVLVITTLTCKVGSWFTQGSGYHFHCYARSGTNYYWRRIGQPQSIQRPINASTHPNICAALLAHDFTAGAYTQSGLETTYQDQTFYDTATRKYFIKVTSTIWERIN